MSSGADPPRALRARGKRLAALSFATGLWIPIVARVLWGGRGRLLGVGDAPRVQTAVVFGAGVRGERPSPVLEDRLLTAIDLWSAGTVENLFLSGNAASPSGDETEVMARFARAHGVPDVAIAVDPVGRTTFETCLHARGAGLKRVALVTQRFHLPRALYLARAMGLLAHGGAADRRRYQWIGRYRLREIPASVLAYWMAGGLTGG